MQKRAGGGRPRHWLLGKSCTKLRGHGFCPREAAARGRLFRGGRIIIVLSQRTHSFHRAVCGAFVKGRPQGADPSVGGARRPPHIDTALRKDRGPAADAAGPLLYGGTAKKHAHHPDE